MYFDIVPVSFIIKIKITNMEIGGNLDGYNSYTVSNSNENQTNCIQMPPLLDHEIKNMALLIYEFDYKKVSDFEI